MTDPFTAPPEPAADEPALAPAEEARLAYVHATIAPKILAAATLGLVSLFGVGSGLVRAFADPETRVVGLLNVILYGIALLAALVAGLAGAQGFRASAGRSDRVARALDTELLFWQTAAFGTLLVYATCCGGGVLAVLGQL